MTLSLAGIPFGKRARSSPSRSTVARVARVANLARLGLVVPLEARADWPTTPCARFLCAPREAARENVLPHSGHVNVWPALDVFFARALAAEDDFLRAAVLRVPVLARALGTLITSVFVVDAINATGVH